MEGLSDICQECAGGEPVAVWLARHYSTVEGTSLETSDDRVILHVKIGDDVVGTAYGDMGDQRIMCSNCNSPWPTTQNFAWTEFNKEVQ